ncbi:YceI family protein [Kamptonema cortianum]|nr:YceI family protein [Geitlerinema splendidum]MDK3156102.1 YceI family protein [Kamptonema cortianum]
MKKHNRLRLLALGVPSLAIVPLAWIALHPGVDEMSYSPVGEPTLIAEKAVYEVDQLHGGISFEIGHLELTNVHGRFNTYSGEVIENGEDLTKASVTFKIETKSIDTAVAARDEHLRSADYFEVEKYPAITFVSRSVRKTDTGYAVTGDLTMKGKTKLITIPFKHYGPYTMSVGDQSTRIGVVAEPIVLKRSDFGVGEITRMPDGRLGGSDEVTIRLAFEAILKKD